MGIVQYLIILMKHNREVAWFLLISLQMVGVFCFCEGSFTGTYETCTFQYGYIDPNCTIFQFNDCMWTECVEYVTVGNDTYCNQYETFSDSNWDSCSNRCCMESLPLGYDSFQKCDQNVKKYVIKIVIIVCSVIGGLILITVVICCICKCRDQISAWCGSIGQCCRAACQGLAYILTCGCIRRANTYKEPESCSNSAYSDNNNSMAEICQWRSEEVHNQKLNESCCICLEPSPSLQLQCGHIYHRQCIMACIDKKKECILCRAVNIDQIKIYCEGCYNKFYMGNLKVLGQSLRGKQQFCEKCKEIN